MLLEPLPPRATHIISLALKCYCLLQDLAEGELRMELMRAQIETEKRKAAFYEKAGMAIEDGSSFLEIRSPSQGVLTPFY